MKRWIRWAAWLYPAEWRVRYGAEFDVLLDDAGLQWGDLADVIRGAAIMQMTTWMSYWKMALLAAITGAILAGGASLAIPDVYVCTAALQIAPRGIAGGETEETQTQMNRSLQQITLEVLGRDNLIRLIQDPVLDLYPKQRKRQPVEEIAEDVFRKHVRVVPFGPTSHESDGQAFRIVFEYPDRFKAQKVVAELASSFLTQNLIRPAVGNGAVMSILEAVVVPKRPTYPARANIALLGAIAGMMMGLISLKIWRRTRTYAVLTMSIPKDTKQFVDLSLIHI